MNSMYLCASLAALLTCGLHVLVGGRLFATPLLASAMHRVVRLTLYYCWHIVSVVIAGLAAGFCYLAFSPDALVLGIGLAGLAAALALLSIVIVVTQRVNPLHMPQWSFFATIALFGGWGIFY